eukprot:GHVQ01015131.1.p1 GENE.GHVQ01015131.1~~GHVQ01015131.1.p1  ORF type:complete len:1443 (+),score=191.93 GHVQ01015131.1:231-4559(+)
MGPPRGPETSCSLVLTSLFWLLFMSVLCLFCDVVVSGVTAAQTLYLVAWVFVSPVLSSPVGFLSSCHSHTRYSRRLNTHLTAHRHVRRKPRVLPRPVPPEVVERLKERRRYYAHHKNPASNVFAHAPPRPVLRTVFPRAPWPAADSFWNESEKQSKNPSVSAWSRVGLKNPSPMDNLRTSFTDRFHSLSPSPLSCFPEQAAETLGHSTSSAASSDQCRYEPAQHSRSVNSRKSRRGFDDFEHPVSTTSPAGLHPPQYPAASSLGLRSPTCHVDHLDAIISRLDPKFGILHDMSKTYHPLNSPLDPDTDPMIPELHGPNATDPVSLSNLSRRITYVLTKGTHPSTRAGALVEQQQLSKASNRPSGIPTPSHCNCTEPLRPCRADSQRESIIPTNTSSTPVDVASRESVGMEIVGGELLSCNRTRGLRAGPMLKERCVSSSSGDSLWDMRKVPWKSSAVATMSDNGCLSLNPYLLSLNSSVVESDTVATASSSCARYDSDSVTTNRTASVEWHLDGQFKSATVCPTSSNSHMYGADPRAELSPEFRSRMNCCQSSERVVTDADSVISSSILPANISSCSEADGLVPPLPPPGRQSTLVDKKKVKDTQHWQDRTHLSPPIIPPPRYNMSDLICISSLPYLTPPPNTPTFASLGLNDTCILDNLYSSAIRYPTEAQSTTIPLLLRKHPPPPKNSARTSVEWSASPERSAGIVDSALGPMASKWDVVLDSPTGSGKTIAFLLPLLQQLTHQVAGTQMLVISPTRELASQTYKVISRLLVGHPFLKAGLVIGGANYRYQQEALKDKRPQVVVGTAGRVLETAEKHLRYFQLKPYCRYLVLDEFDVLLDPKSPHCGHVLGLVEHYLPKREYRQTVLVSATAALAMRYVQLQQGHGGGMFGGMADRADVEEVMKNSITVDQTHHTDLAKHDSRNPPLLRNTNTSGEKTKPTSKQSGYNNSASNSVTDNSVYTSPLSNAVATSPTKAVTAVGVAADVPTYFASDVSSINRPPASVLTPSSSVGLSITLSERLLQGSGMPYPNSQGGDDVSPIDCSFVDKNIFLWDFVRTHMRTPRCLMVSTATAWNNIRAPRLSGIRSSASFSLSGSRSAEEQPDDYDFREFSFSRYSANKLLPCKSHNSTATPTSGSHKIKLTSDHSMTTTRKVSTSSSPSCHIMTTPNHLQSSAVWTSPCVPKPETESRNDVSGSACSSYLGPPASPNVTSPKFKMPPCSSASNPSTSVPSNLHHVYITVKKNEGILEKFRRLAHCAPRGKRMLVFCKDEPTVDWMYQHYIKAKHATDAKNLFRLSGYRSKLERSNFMAAIWAVTTRPVAEGRSPDVSSSTSVCILATELAARGLDIPCLSHVVNLDMPKDATHYLHRAGRVGRAGNPGVVVTITQSKKLGWLKKIGEDTGLSLHAIRIHGGHMWKCKDTGVPQGRCNNQRASQDYRET